MVNAEDGTNRLFIVQQRGKIMVIQNSPTISTKKTFVDLTSKVTQNAVAGLFGLAFHPNYETNRHFYVNYVFDSAGSISGKYLRVSRYTSSATNADTTLLNTERILVTAPLPGIYHNGGKLGFGPDGYLYISFGDGYSGGAPAQDKTVLLGKILRIDVDQVSAGKSYSIPPTNPYYQNTQGFRQEIYALGLRNLWKFSFDTLTNRMWAGDVGESKYEEIDLIENGKNYGWNKMEGFNCYPYPPAVCDTTGYGFTRPIYEYPRTVGKAIMGGYVYRGSLYPELYGKYIYGDEIEAKVWALDYQNGAVTSNIQLLDTNFDLVSFGVDQNNEIYALSYSELNGTIFRLVNKGVISLNVKAIPQGYYNDITKRLNMRDSVKVTLVSNFAPFQKVDSAYAVLDSVTYSAWFSFRNAPTGTYYLKVNHEGSIETWSKAGGQSLVRGAMNYYDFTNNITQAYSSNMQLVDTSPLRYALYSGDVNQDHSVNLLDINVVYYYMISFLPGFGITDLDGNGVINSHDMVLSYNNSISFVALTRP
jgi:glucose/arabinose dehydrogenase